MISWAVKSTSMADLKASTSKRPSSWRNFIRLRLARLHAELSMCMYSEQGFEPLMRSVFGEVCHALIVVSNCRPGSAHSHAARAIWRQMSRALTVRTVAPPSRAVRVQVEAIVAQDPRLLLLIGLAPDELFDVGVVSVEDDHLRGATGLAAGLDGARRRIGAAHERHGTRGGATTFEEFDAGTDLRQVDARAGAALEDDAFFGVPVED